MTRIRNNRTPILGTLASADGLGVIRMQDRFRASIEHAWSALTEPQRLAHWYGEVDGALRVGGEFRARVHASGWEGTSRVEACDAPQRLLIVAKEPDDPHEHSTEVTLGRDGDQTTLV